MLKIESIMPGSYAEEIGLQPGDRLLSINSQPVNDLLDYYLSLETERLQLEVLCANDELWDLDIEKGLMDDLGLEVEHPDPRVCGNQCQFCFVHQLPKGMRKTLYVKDEDYRFSYLYGSYITLSNLSEEDYTRIIEKQLSPLYVSVHATDAQVRGRLLGSEVPAVLPLIERLTSHGISLHCQVVLCPGLNDKEILDQTIADLSALYPQVASLAVVPVGLTQFREKLPVLERLNEADAALCLDQIHGWQDKLLKSCGSRFVFAADEIYLRAQRDFPELEAYEDFAQIENGVGMIAQFRAQTEEVLLETAPLGLKTVTLITGSSFYEELRDFCHRLSLRCGTTIQLVPIRNDFFGPQITVTGLLTGADIISQLKGKTLGQALLVPDVLLRDGDLMLLDDLTLEDISQALQVPVVDIDNTPWGLLDALELLDLNTEIEQC